MKSIVNEKVNKFLPVLFGKERGLTCKKVQGMWKQRKPSPIEELAKMRKEWGNQ